MYLLCITEVTPELPQNHPNGIRTTSKSTRNYHRVTLESPELPQKLQSYIRISTYTRSALQLPSYLRMTSWLPKFHQNYPNYLTFTSELPKLAHNSLTVNLRIASSYLSTPRVAQLPIVTSELTQCYLRKPRDTATLPWHYHRITRVTPELPDNYPIYLRMNSEWPELPQIYLRMTTEQVTWESGQNYTATSKLPQDDLRMTPTTSRLPLSYPS